MFQVELRIGLGCHLPIGDNVKDKPIDSGLFTFYSRTALLLRSHGTTGDQLLANEPRTRANITVMPRLLEKE